MHSGEVVVIQEPPPPWKKQGEWAVGGLSQVGYAEDTDLLLVLSSQGRGVFDCLTGKRLARDYEEAHDFFDPVKLLAQGFGPLEGQNVRMAGLFGGGLPTTTADDWSLQEVLTKSARTLFTRTFFLSSPDDSFDAAIAEEGACEARAFGFSETGLSFVIAISCDLYIFSRGV